MISVIGFFFSSLPGITVPAGVVVVDAPVGVLLLRCMPVFM
jgi:hypothetical protein